MALCPSCLCESAYVVTSGESVDHSSASRLHCGFCGITFEYPQAASTDES
jgi:hypothetical protein